MTPIVRECNFLLEFPWTFVLAILTERSGVWTGRLFGGALEAST